MPKTKKKKKSILLKISPSILLLLLLAVVSLSVLYVNLDLNSLAKKSNKLTVTSSICDVKKSDKLCKEKKAGGLCKISGYVLNVKKNQNVKNPICRYSTQNTAINKTPKTNSQSTSSVNCSDASIEINSCGNLKSTRNSVTCIEGNRIRYCCLSGKFDSANKECVEASNDQKTNNSQSDSYNKLSENMKNYYVSCKNKGFYFCKPDKGISNTTNCINGSGGGTQYLDIVNHDLYFEENSKGYNPGFYEYVCCKYGCSAESGCGKSWSINRNNSVNCSNRTTKDECDDLNLDCGWYYSSHEVTFN